MKVQVIKEAKLVKKDPYVVVQNPRNPEEYAAVRQSEADKERWFNYTKEEAQAQADKWNNTWYLSDYSEEDINAFINSIPLKQLYSEINERVGLNLTFSNDVERSRNGEIYLEVVSNENLVDLVPIFKLFWKDCRLETFNTQITVDKETGELFWWATIHLKHEAYDGGRNGEDFLRILYTAEKGLQVREDYNRNR